MDIFRLFESKKFMKICSKTHQLAPFKFFLLGSIPRTPPSYATRRKHPKRWPHLANPAYAHALLLKNLFEEMRS